MAAKACSTCHAVLLLQLISRANGAAGGIAAALVLMQATRLLPGPTQSAAEPTTGTTAAAASADTDENDRVCVGGVGACSVLRAATQGDIGAPAGCGLLLCADCVQHVQHVQRGAHDVHGLLIAALTALVRAIRPVAPKACCTCHAVLLQLI